MTKAVLGIIGGSGIYDLPGLENVRDETIESPWGEPSSSLRQGTIEGLPIVFSAAPWQGAHSVAFRHQLPRQYRRAETGGGHRPRLALGLRFVQGRVAARHLRACRSIRRSHPQAREFVLRQGLRRPCVDGPSGIAAAANSSGCCAAAEGIAATDGGTYVCMEGPQFSSLAESLTYKAQGYSVIGMTNMPEAKLAREARDLLRQCGDGHRFRLLAS